MNAASAFKANEIDMKKAKKIKVDDKKLRDLPPTPGLSQDFDETAFNKFDQTKVSHPGLGYGAVMKYKQHLEERIDHFAHKVHDDLEPGANKAIEAAKKANELTKQQVQLMNKVNENRVTQSNELREDQLKKTQDLLQKVTEETYEGIEAGAPKSEEEIQALIAEAKGPVPDS